MSFKQTDAKFAKENSFDSASLKFNVDCKRIREWVNKINEISTKKSIRKRSIIEIEENLLERIHERRSKVLHVSRKMIRIKAKAMFVERTDDTAVKETLIASSGSIQNFMKRHNLSCRLIFIL